MADTGAKTVKLPVEDQDVSRLRDDEGLPGKLLLQPDRAPIGADAHRAGRIESNENILLPAAYRDGLRLDLRRVNGQRGGALDMGVNRAAIESHGERAGGFQHGKMCGAAGGDPATFDEVDPRGTRLYANVAAAAENRFHLAVDGFDAHGAADGDGFAVNDADGVCAGVVGAGRGGGEERGAKHGNGSGR